MSGGLQIPETLGLGATQQEEIERQWGTYDEIDLELTRMGVDEYLKPNCSVPRITAQELLETDDREFTELYGNVGEWYSYLNNMHARYKAKEIEFKNEMTDIEVHVRKRELDKWKKTKATNPKAKKPTIQELSDAVWLDPRRRELTLEVQKLDQAMTLLNSRIEQCYRDMKNLSRQVTIRSNELERHRTERNMPHGRAWTPREHNPPPPGYSPPEDG